MTPLQKYQHALASGQFIEDEGQLQAVHFTQALYELLVQTNTEANDDGALKRLWRRIAKPEEDIVRGLYFWGGVGRGKTWIVDAFYECLPFENKLRIHFHRFMRRVHHELKLLENTENPLEVVAEIIAAEARIICFDEFHVSDITDAMLLGGLFKSLFERGVVLVATSNTEPDNLYWDGLQRERFLPAIALLKQYTNVVNVDSECDYRLRHLDKAEIYLCGPKANVEKRLQEHFERIAPDASISDSSIDIEGRQIEARRSADGVIWFDFEKICDGPRGAADYIEIGRIYQTVIISDIPQLDDNNNDLAKRFITLIDEFYDRNVKLIVSAASNPQDLYRGSRLRDQFERTISRLVEMQTHDYLALQHLSQ